MSTMSASEARKNLFPLMGQVNEDHDVVRITSKAGNAVMVSEVDYEAWQSHRDPRAAPRTYYPNRGPRSAPAG
jgi:prevent-host-death family protein